MVATLLERAGLADFGRRILGKETSRDLPALAAEEASQSAFALSPDPANQAAVDASAAQQLGEIARASVQLAALGPRIARLGADMKAQAEAQARRASAIAETMEALTKDLERAVDELRSSSGQVDDALATVSRIAEHTRIISLNASIEAARAGVHGRAFAVVVEEVQRLADSTGTTTHAIEARMHEMQSSIVRVATVAGSRTEGEVDDGRTRSVEAVNSEVHGMARSAEKQLSGVKQLHELSDGVHSLTESLLMSVGQFRFAAHAKAETALAELVPSLLAGRLDRRRSEALLGGWLARHPAFELVYLTDESGRQIVDNLVRSRGEVTHDRAGFNRDWSDRPWYRAALNHEGLYSTDIYRSTATGDFCFTVAVALRDDNGGLLGVLGADVNFQRLLEH